MATHAKLSTWFDGELVPLINGKPEDGLFIQTVVTHPESMVGRKVYVHVAAEQVAQLMIELRSEAIRQRSKPMSTESTDG